MGLQMDTLAGRVAAAALSQADAIADALSLAAPGVLSAQVRDRIL
jgi:hypothetical protein